ncbi:putative abieta-7,13-dien-18-ol hydroxylase [Helianthus anomalus]
MLFRRSDDRISLLCFLFVYVDLVDFGDGIFTVDGDKWRHLWKLASFEFSTRNLHNFSSVVFMSNGVKLAKNISLLAAADETMNLQALLLKFTLDSIFKVGFGFDLDTLSGLDEASNRFMKVFDESNSLTFWRFVDLLWKVKRYFSIGPEAELKKTIRMVDEFVHELIRNKREQMKDTNLHRDKEDMTDKYLRDITLSFVIA